MARADTLNVNDLIEGRLALPQALIAIYLCKTLGPASRTRISAIERRVGWTLGASSILISALFLGGLGLNLARGASLMRRVTRDARRTGRRAPPPAVGPLAVHCGNAA